MKNKIYSLPDSLILFLTILILTFIFCMSNAYSHKKNVDGKMVEHEPITCKPPEKRNYLEKQFCKIQLRQHRLCKLEEHCADFRIRKIAKRKCRIKEKNLKGVADCGDMPFNHKASTNSIKYI